MNVTLKKKEKESTINEFNQEIVGNSLTKDAWHRLKKNKMAVISVVIVTLYIILAASAPLLPIYPYDEIILDHQHLKPSLKKTAGELLLEKRMAELYTQSWRQGNLKLSEEEDDLIWSWIDKNEITKVWAYMYKVGSEMEANGSYTLTAAEQRSVDTLMRKLKTDLQITVNRVWNTDSSGLKVKIEKLPIDEIVALYANMIGSTVEIEENQYMREIEQQRLKIIQSQNSDASNSDLQVLLEAEMENMSQKQLDTLIKTNVMAKIKSYVKDIASRDLLAAATDGSIEFPINKEISIQDTISAKIKATKKHDRRYYLGTDHQGRDMLSRIIYGGQVSIAIGFIGTVTSVLIGVLLGALAGYIGGKVDYFIMRIVDIMYGLPYMLLVIIAMAIFGRNILNLFFALAIISWLTVSRMVRGKL